MTSPERTDRGAGLFGAIGGVLVFLTLLTFATQLLLNLYATSAVTAAAHDAAHLVAAGVHDRADPSALATVLSDAEARGRQVLGSYGEQVEFDWEVDDDWVNLTVRAQLPRVAIHTVSGAFGLNQVERTVRVRAEQPR